MLKCQKKWLELFLKKFLLCTFRNNVESETVLYLTNGRKRVRWIIPMDFLYVKKAPNRCHFFQVVYGLSFILTRCIVLNGFNILLLRFSVDIS